MAAERAAIREDHIVSHPAIMRDVGVSHKEAIVSDCGLAGRSRSAVQCDKLANNNPVANRQRGRLASVLDILGRTSNSCKRIDLAVAADAAATMNDGVCADECAFSDCDIVLNYRERTDLDAVGKRRFRTYVRKGINMDWHYFEGEFLLVVDNW
jgi:hypothetical protein